MAMRALDELSRQDEDSASKGRSSPTLSWKDFFGSSVDLAPSVMNIFDSYITSTVDESCQRRGSNRSLPLSQDVKSEPTSTVSQCHMQGQRDISLACRDSGYISNSERPLVNANGYTDHRRKLLRQEAVMSGMESTNGSHGHKISNCLMTSDYQGQTDTSKKRPLSIASTSSSASSTSSLPRHQKKKSLTASMASTCLSSSGSNKSNQPSVHMYEENEEFDMHASGENVSQSYTTDCDSKSSSLDRDCESGVAYSGCSARSTDGLALEIEEPTDFMDSNKVRQDEGLSHIEKVVEEIIFTERTYVSDLKDIIQGYLCPVTQHASDLNITPEQVDALFANIRDIYAFNSELLAQLEKCELDPVQVAQCFVAQTKGFVIYSEYCTNYPRCVEVLTHCMRSPLTAEVFKQQQIALHHGLPLGSYLLKPVQRVLKYHLLLQNLLHDFEEHDLEDRSYVEDALTSMTSMAQHINDMKRQHEHLMRVQEIQCLLYGWDGADLTTFGDLVLEDSFRMHGVKGKRHLLLFNKGLLITKKKEDGNMQVKDTIMCANLMLVESIPKDPLSFHLIPFNNPRIQHTVQARNLDQKRSWCQELKQLILDNYSAVIPEKAKALVMQLGKSREEEDYEESQLDGLVETHRNKHSAPEYLQRRRGRRRSTSIVPDFGLLKSRKSTKKMEHSSPKSSPQMQRKTVTDRNVVAPSSAPVVSGSDVSPLEKGKSGPALRVRSVSTIVPPTSLHVNSSEEEAANVLTHSIENLSPIKEAQDNSESQQVDHCRLRETTYDDSSRRASRLSQVLDEEGLSQQLIDSPEKGLHWDKEIVTSVLSVPAVRRAESCKLTKKLNGIDAECSKPQSYNEGDSSRRLSLTDSPSVAYDDDVLRAVLSGGKCEIRQRYTATSSRSNYANVVCANVRGDIPYIDDNDNDDDDVDDYVEMAHVVKNRTPVSHKESDERLSEVESSLKRRPFSKCSSPVRTTAYINKDLRISQYDVSCHTDCLTSSPWVLRSEASSSSQSDTHTPIDSCHLNDCVFHSPSIEELDETQPHLKSPLSRPEKCLSLENVVFHDHKAYISCGSPPSVRRCTSLDNHLARLTTPPPELGPADVIRQIQNAKLHARRLDRYGTPPRTMTESDRFSGMSCNSYGLSHPCAAASRVEVHSPSCRHTSSSASSETSPLQHHVTMSPTSPTRVLAHHAALFSPHLTSPTSVASTDSLVGSLKQAVASITGKITGKSASGGVQSPRRTPRARSANALDELRIDLSSGIDPRLQRSDTNKKKKKKHPLVHNLVRAYSDRVKNRTFKISFIKHKDSKDKSVEGPAKVKDGEETFIATEEKSMPNKVDGSTPIILGAYSLPSLRPPRPKPTQKPAVVAKCTLPIECAETVRPENIKADEIKVKLEGSEEDPASESDGANNAKKESSLPSNYQCEVVNIPVEHYFTVTESHDEHDGSDTDESFVDEYYENKFVEDLENNFPDKILLESPEKGRIVNRVSSAEHVACLRESIKDTVKVIEQKYNAQGGNGSKVEVPSSEKCQNVRQILRHLESGDLSSNAALHAKWQSMFPDRAPLRPIKDRHRELVECATLTRIRQASCTVGEEVSSVTNAEDDAQKPDKALGLGSKG